MKDKAWEASFILLGALIIFTARCLFIVPYRLWSEALADLPPVGYVTVHHVEFEKLQGDATRGRQSARALAKSKRLEQWVENLDQTKAIFDLASSELQARLTRSKTGEITQNWREHHWSNRHVLKEIRSGIAANVRDLFEEACDLEATPQFDRNPYAIKAPDVDKVDSEELKQEYRQEWERIMRTEDLLQKLPGKIAEQIIIENKKIDTLGFGAT
ncbi:hypothetical protein GCM10007919_58690 [Rhizobium indigoferae]|nr:hypothetical protein GCM10007919_58690 [Rhizobium indigoferae]